MLKKLRFIPALALIFNFSLAQPTVQLQLYTTNVFDPTAITNAGDDRLFICEQVGRIRIVNSGVLSPTPFLDIQSRVTSGGEQGLLGLAFSPNYATDSSFYVYYTDTNGIGNTVVSRFRVSATNPDSALASSEQILLTEVQPYSNHNGGCIQFGRDGYLYIGLGDGGSGGDPQNYAQNPLTFLGKILRIDVSNTSSSTYTIPPSNPFFGMSSVYNEIWSLGWRNPWRYSFDRYTGEMWIADVGQGTWEEIDREAYGDGGLNYGWRCREGAHPYNTTGCTSTYTDPVYEYSHAATGGCSVTGGYVYRGSDYASLSGYYYYADYCNGQVYALDYNTYTNYSVATGYNSITTFGEDRYGELYAGRSNGLIYKLVNSSSCAPNATIINTTGTFYCGDSVQLVTPFNPAFTYQWFFNGSPIANATGNSVYADTSGNYTVYVEKNITCFDTSAVFVLGPCGNVNVQNIDENVSLQILPNPSDGKFNIVIKGVRQQNLSYSVTDALGRLVLSEKMNCESGNCISPINLKSPGVYFVQVNNGDEIIARQKAVIQ